MAKVQPDTALARPEYRPGPDPERGDQAVALGKLIALVQRAPSHRRPAPAWTAPSHRRPAPAWTGARPPRRAAAWALNDRAAARAEGPEAWLSAPGAAGLAGRRSDLARSGNVGTALARAVVDIRRVSDGMVEKVLPIGPVIAPDPQRRNSGGSAVAAIVGEATNLAAGYVFPCIAAATTYAVVSVVVPLLHASEAAASAGASFGARAVEDHPGAAARGPHRPAPGRAGRRALSRLPELCVPELVIPAVAGSRSRKSHP